MPVTEVIIHSATPADAPAILEIYAPFIEGTAITFEYTVPTIAEFTNRIMGIQQAYPYFVAVVNNRIAGYAYATKFRERAAYQWDIETSVYVAADFHQQGIASALYNKLLQACADQGYCNTYAVITLPNPQSEAFHAKFGFTKIGVFNHTGFKNGEWHSVLFMEKQLKTDTHPPSAIQKPLIV